MALRHLSGRTDQAAFVCSLLGHSSSARVSTPHHFQMVYIRHFREIIASIGLNPQRLLAIIEATRVGHDHSLDLAAMRDPVGLSTARSPSKITQSIRLDGIKHWKISLSRDHEDQAGLGMPMWSGSVEIPSCSQTL
jgi:hypothetical protein